MLTVKEIKPCQFCGWDDVTVTEVDLGMFAIDCTERECIGPICGAVENAVDMWNKAARVAA